MLTLKQMVANENKVRFVFYRDRALHSETEDGFIFPVPIDDAGSATFGTEEKALLLMRYIRKQLNVIEQAKQSQEML